MALRGEVDLHAVLPSPPPTLPIWGKVLWYLAETVAIGVTYLKFDYGQAINPVAGGTGGAPEDTWRRFQFVAVNTLSTQRADDQVFTLDVVNYTNGQVDNSWTDQDYQDVGTEIFTFVTAFAPHMASWLSFEEVRAYVMAFNPYSLTDKPFAQSGSPEHLYTLQVAGTGLGNVPPQGCTTVTELTPARRHWGRAYLPTLGSEQYTGGRLLVSSVDGISVAWNTLLVDLAAKGFYSVVPVTQVDKSPVRALQNVIGTKVDDVPDVVRRRRYREPAHSSTLSAPA